MNPRNSPLDFRALYNAFNSPTTPVDCGMMCAPYNSNRIPFCCDICSAVPVAYKSEWEYLRGNTSLWHPWRGDECAQETSDRSQLTDQTTPHLCLLACQGPAACERSFRAVSCRQFPFFPYFTADFHFIGMTYDWEFAQTCWVISNLSLVTAEYRREFIAAYDKIFETWLEDMDCYVELSAETREHYLSGHKRIPLLHRNGRAYLVSPRTERLYRVSALQFPRFAPYAAPDPH